MHIYIYIICIYSSCLVQIIALYTPVIYTYYKNIGNQKYIILLKYQHIVN